MAYVVDISGSLVDSSSDVMNWLGEAMDQLRQPAYFTILFFRNHQIIKVPPQGLKRNTFRAKARIFNWIQLNQRHIKPMGQSDIGGAIQAARHHDVDAVYIVSDDGLGIGPAWENGPEKIRQLTNMVGPYPLHIHTVQFYYRDPVGALEAIANRFDGSYTFIEPSVHGPRFVIDLYGDMSHIKQPMAQRDW